MFNFPSLSHSGIRFHDQHPVHGPQPGLLVHLAAEPHRAHSSEDGEQHLHRPLGDPIVAQGLPQLRGSQCGLRRRGPKPRHGGGLCRDPEGPLPGGIGVTNIPGCQVQ